MYNPKQFKQQEQEVLTDFIRKNSFGILFSDTGNGPEATHLPFILEEDAGELYLLSHFALMNQHWKTLDGKDVLIVFSGPHAYISAGWYEEEGTVPTWNYIAVHAKGMVELIKDEDERLNLLEKTVKFYEDELNSEWKVDFANPTIQKELNYIMPFKIQIASLEGKWKLNQHHPVERRKKTIERLRQTNQYDSQLIADYMEKNVGGEKP